MGGDEHRLQWINLRGTGTDVDRAIHPSLGGNSISQGAQDLFNSSVFSMEVLSNLNGYCIQLTADIYVGENYSDFAVVPLGLQRLELHASGRGNKLAVDDIQWQRFGPVVPWQMPQIPRPYALGLLFGMR